jgi:shikimate kinase
MVTIRHVDGNKDDSYSYVVSKLGIVLIGMAGVGKSTVGSLLAKVLGLDFVDLDTYLHDKEGKTIQQIIDDQGEAALLELEKWGMYEIDLDHKVVSPGGSIVYNPEIMEYLKQATDIIYLDDTFENIKSKLGNALTRGIVGLKSKSLQEIYNERRPLYAQYADITINVDGKSKEEVVSEIIKYRHMIFF